MPGQITESLAPYGVPAAAVVDLRVEPGPAHVPYLDLVRARGRGTRLPDAVLKVRDGTLAWVVDAEHERPAEAELTSLRRTLAFRDEAPYLLVREPGRLSAYGVSLDGRDSRGALLEIVPRADPRSRSTFSRLQASQGHSVSATEGVQDLLVDLLSRAVSTLAEEGDLGSNDAIALAGRALFLRFLLDRGILAGIQPSSVHPDTTHWEDAFDSNSATQALCGWLDATFNGDLLPLSFTTAPLEAWPLGSRGRCALRDILFRSSSPQLSLGTATEHRRPASGWPDLDFAHIPVGVLSQVYERLAFQWDPRRAVEDSVHYTPRRLAEYMVAECFAATREDGQIAPDEVRVLDPSAGGGVFLVAAFREIVAARWRKLGRAPNSGELRQILYGQIAGFDISEPALRLTALALYLAVLELDRDPRPLAKLKFKKPLRDNVLFNMRQAADPDAGPVMGSLGEHALGGHRGRYHLVIGNPPWTSVGGEPATMLHTQVVEALRPTVARRLGDERARIFAIPDKVPDLPFVWRAMEWAASSGRIAFALHARLLFKDTPIGQRAREDLFDAMHITGVLNGAELRNTAVWPDVAAQFCLLFAVNERPPEDATLLMVSPHLEPGLNRQGRLRVDPTDAQPISLDALHASPHLLKALFRGTSLDADILRRLEARRYLAFAEWWASLGLAAGHGYQTVQGDGGDRNDASHMIGWPDLGSRKLLDYLVPEALPAFDMAVLHRPRDPAIYEPPVLLVRESPPSDARAPRAHVCLRRVAYSRSYVGYSAAEHPDGELLVKYLALVLHSSLMIWYSLMTSSRFGVEREGLLKRDIDAFPVRPLGDLDLLEREAIPGAFDALVRSGWTPEHDTWISRIYGLSRWDVEVIRDTLEVAQPFARSQERAVATPSPAEMMSFAQRLRTELGPFVPKLAVRTDVGEPDSMWGLLQMGMDPLPSLDLDAPHLVELLGEADRVGASQIVVPDPTTHRIVLGVLRRYRYWTPSRARLLALEILAEHLSTLTTTGHA